MDLQREIQTVNNRQSNPQRHIWKDRCSLMISKVQCEVSKVNRPQCSSVIITMLEVFLIALYTSLCMSSEAEDI